MKYAIKTGILATLLAFAGTGCDKPARTSRDIVANLKLKYIGNVSYTEKVKTERMDSRFPRPQDLEFQVRDMDGDGKFELTASYGTNDFLVKADSTNSFKVIPYKKEIKLTEFD